VREQLVDLYDHGEEPERRSRGVRLDGYDEQTHQDEQQRRLESDRQRGIGQARERGVGEHHDADGRNDHGGEPRQRRGDVRVRIAPHPQVAHRADNSQHHRRNSQQHEHGAAFGS